MTREEGMAVLEEFGAESKSSDVWGGPWFGIGLWGGKVVIQYTNQHHKTVNIEEPMDSMPVEVFRACMFEVFVSLRRD